MEHICPDSIRRYAAKLLIKQAGSDSIKEMAEYADGIDKAVCAGMEIFNADPAVAQGKVINAIIEALREPLNACRAAVIKADKKRRDAEQNLNLKRQAQLQADAESQRPDAELAALLPGMPEAVQTLEGKGIKTVRELLNLAEERGMLTLTDIGLTPEDSQTLVQALYVARYDIARLAVTTPTVAADAPVANTDEQPAPQTPADTRAHARERLGKMTEDTATNPPEPSPDNTPDTPGEGVQEDTHEEFGESVAGPQPDHQASDAADADEGLPDPDPDQSPLIAEESDLNDRIIDTLKAAKIVTRNDLLDHIARDGRLDTIRGVGESSAKAITAYLESLQQ